MIVSVDLKAQHQQSELYRRRLVGSVGDIPRLVAASSRFFYHFASVLVLHLILIRNGLSLIASFEVARRSMATVATEPSSGLVPLVQFQSSRNPRTEGSSCWAGTRFQHLGGSMVGCACV